MIIEPNSSPAKLNDFQKKQLEKIFARCFDQQQAKNPVINQEGLSLCQEAGVNPDDLMPRTLEYFKSKQSVEEVANIRHQHHIQKRFSKLH